MNMKYFECSHLPDNLQRISAPIKDLADKMQMVLPEGDEKEAGLRKLLEAKDCFVRAAIEDKPEHEKKDLSFSIKEKIFTEKNTEGATRLKCILSLDRDPSIKINFIGELPESSQPMGFQYRQFFIENTPKIHNQFLKELNKSK